MINTCDGKDKIIFEIYVGFSCLICRHFKCNTNLSNATVNRWSTLESPYYCPFIEINVVL